MGAASEARQEPDVIVRRERITSTYRAALCLLWLAVAAGCRGDMVSPSPKEGIGALGKVLSPGRCLRRRSSGEGAAEAAALAAVRVAAPKAARERAARGSSGSSTGGHAGTGVGGGAGSSATGGSSNGGGAGVAVDPCRACEMARCKIAQPLTPTTAKMTAYASYAMCFSGVPWPGNPGICGGGSNQLKRRRSGPPRPERRSRSFVSPRSSARIRRYTCAWREAT